MIPGQYDMGGYLLGAGTDLHLAPGGLDLGDYEVRTQDSDLDGDGVALGKDTRTGRTITLSLQVWVPPGIPTAQRAARTLDVLGAASVAWRQDSVRSRPGWLSHLTLNLLEGRERTVFGRPRRFSSVVARADYESGAATAIATFATVDDLFYGTARTVSAKQYTAPSDSGLIDPWVDPLSEYTEGASARPSLVDLAGAIRSQMIEIEFTGPCSNPVCEIVGRGSIEYRGRLSAGQTLSLRVHPSFRNLRLNGQQTSFGRIVGTPLDEFYAQPGVNEVRYRADDPSNTSRMTFTVRPAYTHP